MSDGTNRSNKDASSRLSKTSSLASNGGCATPEPLNLTSGCRSPGSINSPLSTASSGLVMDNSPMSGSSNPHTHQPMTNRSYHQRGRYNNNVGSVSYTHSHYVHHSINHHGPPYASNQNPSQPLTSKPLLDFMMQQWHTFENDIHRKSVQSNESNPTLPASPRSHVTAAIGISTRVANSPQRQSQRHSHQHNQWNGANRRYSDMGHYHQNHAGTEHNVSGNVDYSSNTIESGQNRRFRGQISHNNGPDHPWQRGSLINRKNSPNTTGRALVGQRRPAPATITSSGTTLSTTSTAPSGNPTNSHHSKTATDHGTDQSNNIASHQSSLVEKKVSDVTSKMHTMLSVNNNTSSQPISSRQHIEAKCESSCRQVRSHLASPQTTSTDTLSVADQYFTPDPSSSPALNPIVLGTSSCSKPTDPSPIFFQTEESSLPVESTNA